MEHLHEKSLCDADAQVIILADNDKTRKRCTQVIHQRCKEHIA